MEPFGHTLNQRLEAGGASNPIGGTRLIVARNSTVTGYDGLRQAAQDLVLGVQQLKEWGLGDFCDETPTEAELVQRLRESPDTIVVNGSQWRYHTFVKSGLYVIVAAGSGTKLDERGTQPFMERVRDTILRLRPTIVFAREIDRLGRDELGLGQIVRAIESTSVGDHDCVLASGARGIYPKFPGWDIELYFQARQARQQAESLARRTRDVMIMQTSTRMENGRFPYSLPASLPPGLSTARMRDSRGSRGNVTAYLDTAAFRPSDDEVFEPLQAVVDDNGNIADQVACVKWALVELAHGRPTTDVASTLLARGFSTDRLRRVNGPDATFRSVHGRLDPRASTRLCSRILKHLALYETGVLVRTMQGKEILIDGVVPPGGWISPQAAAELRLRQQRRNLHNEHRARSAAGGLRVTVNGIDARLQMITHSCSCRHGIEG